MSSLPGRRLKCRRSEGGESSVERSRYATGTGLALADWLAHP